MLSVLFIPIIRTSFKKPLFYGLFYYEASLKSEKDGAMRKGGFLTKAQKGGEGKRTHRSGSQARLHPLGNQSHTLS